MMARRCSPCLKVTSAMPSTVRSLSSGTFIGPGDGAVPGAGCGKAVEQAVWKVTLPSTFCITWPYSPGDAGGVEGDVAFDLLHHLVNMAVEHRYRAEALERGERAPGILGAPSPRRVHGPQRDM